MSDAHRLVMSWDDSDTFDYPPDLAVDCPHDLNDTDRPCHQPTAPNECGYRHWVELARDYTRVLDGGRLEVSAAFDMWDDNPDSAELGSAPDVRIGPPGSRPDAPDADPDAADESDGGGDE